MVASLSSASQSDIMHQAKLERAGGKFCQILMSRTEETGVHCRCGKQIDREIRDRIWYVDRSSCYYYSKNDDWFFCSSGPLDDEWIQQTAVLQCGLNFVLKVQVWFTFGLFYSVKFQHVYILYIAHSQNKYACLFLIETRVPSSIIGIELYSCFLRKRIELYS